MKWVWLFDGLSPGQILPIPPSMDAADATIQPCPATVRGPFMRPCPKLEPGAKREGLRGQLGLHPGGVRFSHYQDNSDGFDAALLRITSMDGSRATPHPLWAQTAGTTGLITSPTWPEAADGREPFLCLPQRHDGEPADNLTVFLPRNISFGTAGRHALRRGLNALAPAGSDLTWESTDGQSIWPAAIQDGRPSLSVPGRSGLSRPPFPAAAPCRSRPAPPGCRTPSPPVAA